MSVLVTAASKHGATMEIAELDKSGLGFAEKGIVIALRAPEGDYRDWDDIRRWASAIAAVLHAEE